ncbi:hypothetical protein AB0C13_39345, partial [Streptomyces sp. NPDC049099]
RGQRRLRRRRGHRRARPRRGHPERLPRADPGRALAPGGHLVVTYRDLTAELRGTDRFIPVRSSDDRLLTCFLEYRDEDTVIVHDLLHTRTNGSWQQQTGSYPKLRIASSWLVQQCRAAGLDVRRDAADSRGMRILHAVKP